MTFLDAYNWGYCDWNQYSIKTINGNKLQIRYLEMKDNKNYKYENFLDGKFHSIKGTSFYYSKRESRISFYVGSIEVKKKKIRVDVYQEQNHKRPHAHIEDHKASFDLRDGSLIEGECDTKEQKAVQEWIQKNSMVLNEIWTALQNGESNEKLNVLKQKLSC